MPKREHRPTRADRGGRPLLLAVALAASGALLLPSVGSAAVPCWQRLIADWSRDGRVDRTYPLTCYREAVKRLPEDLRAYSSAPDDIDRALTERRSAERRLATPVTMTVQPVAGAEPGGTRSRMVVIVPVVAGVLVAAGLLSWLVRGRPSRFRSR